MSEVQLRNLTKTYAGGLHAVRDMNLTIADGEMVVIVGPSGCGKTTTLRLIAGLEESTSGAIYIGSKPVHGVRSADRDIAMVFQDVALYPHLTVRQNLAFGLKMRRTPKLEIEQRVGETAAILALESLLDRRPAELSGGQRQRVAVGRAIVRQPRLFLFDEPLSNLDANLRVQLRTEIARLHKRLQTTMIYVTHDQVEAMTLGERIVVMDHGVIQQIDSPLNLYLHPANRFVAQFIGNLEMNLFAGHVTGGMVLHGSSRLPVPGVPDGPVQLGIRPEDLLTEPAGPPFGDFTIDSIDRMGHATVLYFECDGAHHAARLVGNPPYRPGTTISFYIRPDAWHIFAADEEGSRLN